MLAVVFAAWAYPAGARADDPFPVGPPNDPYYQQYQWDLRTIGLPDAWNYTTGSSSVTIAILDTGVVSTTADLTGRLLAPLSAVPNQAPFSDGVLSGSVALRHGTYVAGVAAMGVNNGSGGAGVGNFSILPIRITNFAAGNLSDWIATGIKMAADQGARVINISSSTTDYSALNTAAIYAATKGSLVFIAAGNSDARIDMQMYSDLIFVSGTDENDARWTDGMGLGSSWGPYVDLSAPAHDILVTDPGSASGYGVGSGTSFAAPLASGVAGLVWTINPNLSPSQVRSILETTAHDLGSTGWDETFGYGRIDAAAAVQAALATVPEPQTIVLMVLGMFGLIGARRLRSSRALR